MFDLRGILLFVTAASLVAAGCSTHPGYQTRIKKMDQTIRDEGYQTKGRPYLDDRYREKTGKIR